MNAGSDELVVFCKTVPFAFTNYLSNPCCSLGSLHLGQQGETLLQ
jgi:hypothetical protein